MGESRCLREAERYIAVCIVPDVCLTPCGSSMVPIPYYPQCSFDELANGAADVGATRCAVGNIDGMVPSCQGDEQGTGGGIFSGTVGGACHVLTGSTCVNVRGRPGTGSGHLCCMNNHNGIGLILRSGASDAGGSESPASTPTATPSPAPVPAPGDPPPATAIGGEGNLGTAPASETAAVPTAATTRVPTSVSTAGQSPSATAGGAPPASEWVSDETEAVTDAAGGSMMALGSVLEDAAVERWQSLIANWEAAGIVPPESFKSTRSLMQMSKRLKVLGGASVGFTILNSANNVVISDHKAATAAVEIVSTASGSAAGAMLCSPAVALPGPGWAAGLVCAVVGAVVGFTVEKFGDYIKDSYYAPPYQGPVPVTPDLHGGKPVW
jgi:hypothetical protein